MYRQLDSTTMVSGQILPEEVAEAARAGVTMIINNRPDDEEPGQPSGASIEEAAKAAGLAYRHVPIARGMGPADVAAMRAALGEAGEGKTLAYCRSGMRSTLAWALARREEGASREQVEAAAQRAGFSLAPITHLL